MPKLLEFSVSFDLGAITAQTDALRQLVETGVTEATQAGAQVFYNEVKSRASRLSGTGNLASSIYQYRVREEQRPGHAKYKISWRKGRGGTRAGVAKTADDIAVATLPIAAHGSLVEFGYIQRYASYIGSDGQWYTAVRPEMRGKPKPKRRASQAVKDAYYVLRKGGPVQHPPRSFLRAGYEAAKGPAYTAAKAAMAQRIARGRT